MQKQRKKLLFIMPSQSLPVDARDGGAVEQLMNDLINENEKLQNYDMVFISPSDVNKRYKNTAVVQVVNNRFCTFFIKAINKVFKLLKIKFKISSNYYKKALKISKCINPDKIIIEAFCESNIAKFTEYFGRNKMLIHLHNVEKNKYDLSKYFSRAIVVSNYVKNDWENQFVFRDSFNISILKNCISSTNFMNKTSREQQISDRKKLFISSNDFVILYCGRIHQEKGLDKLINSIKLLNDKKVKLLVVGQSFFNNSKPTKYTKFIREISKPIADQVIFTGYIHNDEVYRYYSLSDLQVIPSVCEEAAGIVAMEGNAIGINQIITNSGGLSEYCGNYYVVHKENSEFMISELSKAIHELLNGGNIHFVHGDNCIQDTKNYYENFSKIIDNQL